jgi:hypothetical protein
LSQSRQSCSDAKEGKKIWKKCAEHRDIDQFCKLPI